MFWEICGLSMKTGFFLSHERKLRQKLILPNEATNTQIIACWYITYIQQDKKKRKKGEIVFVGWKHRHNDNLKGFAPIHSLRVGWRNNGGILKNY